MSSETDGFSLRKATADDRMAIRRLVRSARLNPFNLQWERFVVAIDDRETIIGCGQVRSHRNGSRELASLVVDPAWRHKGVATAVIGRLTFLNDLPLWLTCASTMVPFYEQFEFEVVTRSPAIPWTVRWFANVANRLFRLSGRKITLALMVRARSE